MDKVFLGMPGPWAHDYREPSDSYTTKVGGLPDWPVPKEAIDAELLRCDACDTKLCLLAQVYAPIDNIQQRSLFILGCVTPKCESASRSWRVLRVQNICDAEEEASATASSSGAQNANLLEDLGDDDEGSMNLEELGKALSEAAAFTSKTPKTKKKKSKKTRQDKAVADNDIPVVPCFYIYTQEEPCSKYSSLSIRENGSNAEDASQTEETWVTENYEYEKALTADRTYIKFKKRLDAHPEQCFRYSYGGKPILAVAAEIDPGRCRLCGRPRQFEMQLMPPILYFLQEVIDDDQRQMVENWDWMTLIVYTCPESCCEKIEQTKAESKGWIVAEEAVVAQYEESMPVQLDYFSSSVVQYAESSPVQFANANNFHSSDRDS